MLRRAVVLAVLSTALRIWLAHHFFGFQTGDDVEVLQEAFRAAFGLDYAPWNIRNLLLSEVVVAPLLRVASLLGVTDPFALAAVARYPFILLAGVNVVLVFLLGRAWFSERAGLLAAALYSMHWLPLVFGSSLYVRIPGTTFLLLAALALSRRRHLLAGLLASLAFAMRYSEIIFLAPLLIVGGRQAMAPLLASFAAGVLLFSGGYDWLSWGRPFASLIEFARYTLVERGSSSVIREQPVWWYLTAMPQWLAPPLLPFLWRERRKAFAWILVPLLALSVIHHKELRYLQAIIPFAMILAAHGAMQWWDQGRRTLVIALLILALPLQFARIRSVEKRSMAAVNAAKALQDAPVAVSQQWAYGGKVYLRNGEELGSPPDPERLRAAAPRVECVALFRSEITPEMRTILAGARLTTVRAFEHGRSRTVDVFCRGE